MDGDMKKTNRRFINFDLNETKVGQSEEIIEEEDVLSVVIFTCSTSEPVSEKSNRKRANYIPNVAENQD